MKKLLLVSLLLCNGFLLAQEPLTIKEIDSTSTEVPFNIIENVPIYKGCDPSMRPEELKACMSYAITNLISQNFNTNITNGLGLPDGPVRINVIFKINVDGNIIDAQARAPHPALEKEALRLVSLIPKLDKPGYYKGEPVVVPYSLPILFKVENPKSSKSKKITEDTFPVFRGCDESLSYEAQKACTSEKVSDYVKLSFNYELADKLFPTENSTKFQLDFVINEKGVAEQINVKANKREVAVDVINVVKRMPKFKKPGTVNGKPSKTPVSILMTIYFPH
jgi:hypothetical protein